MHDAWQTGQVVGFSDVDKAGLERRSIARRAHSAVTPNKDTPPSTKLQNLLVLTYSLVCRPNLTRKNQNCTMKLTNVALAVATLSLSVLSAPTPMSMFIQ